MLAHTAGSRRSCSRPLHKSISSTVTVTPPAFFTMASSSAAISLRRLTPANKYSTRNAPDVGGKAKEGACEEDASEPAAALSEPVPNEESVPTITEDVQEGVNDCGNDDAQGKAERDSGESEGGEGHSATTLDGSCMQGLGTLSKGSARMLTPCFTSPVPAGEAPPSPSHCSAKKLWSNPGWRYIGCPVS